jgi:hypothetical protein
MTGTVSTAVSRSLDALDALGLLGEAIDDEWSYVTDLVAAQRARLEAIDRRRGPDPLTVERATAVDLAIEEAGRIADPNRAIDWLSTFPDLVALALDEPIGGPPAPATTPGTTPVGTSSVQPG